MLAMTKEASRHRLDSLVIVLRPCHGLVDNLQDIFPYHLSLAEDADARAVAVEDVAEKPGLQRVGELGRGVGEPHWAPFSRAEQLARGQHLEWFGVAGRIGVEDQRVHRASRLLLQGGASQDPGMRQALREMTVQACMAS